MSLASAAFREWWDNFDRPQQFLDKQFTTNMDTESLTRLLPMPPLTKPFRDYLKPWEVLMTEVKSKQRKDNGPDFEIIVEVEQFEPHEIMVKTVDDKLVVVEARHEEKQNEEGYYSRMFFKRYNVPEEYDITKVTSHLSVDGILTIKAPRL